MILCGASTAQLGRLFISLTLAAAEQRSNRLQAQSLPCGFHVDACHSATRRDPSSRRAWREGLTSAERGSADLHPPSANSFPISSIEAGSTGGALARTRPSFLKCTHDPR